MNLKSRLVLHPVSLPFLFFLPLFSFYFTGCGMAQVLGHTREEAAEILRNGDTTFILEAKLPDDFSQAVSRLKQLEKIHPAAPFYAGLLIGKEAETTEQRKNLFRTELLLFCAALESSCVPAAEEAAQKLIPLILTAGKDREVREILAFLDSISKKIKTEIPVAALRSACLYRLGRYGEAEKLLSGNSAPSNSDGIIGAGDWEKTLSLLAAWKASSDESIESFKQKIPAFLFESSPASSGTEPRRWALKEILAVNDGGTYIGREEIAALNHRWNPIPYPALLVSLRPALADGGILFFRYPELLTDLGRAFQYTPARREEGARLFKSWAILLEDSASTITSADQAPADGSDDFSGLKFFIKTLDSDALNASKFLVHFYSGRINRALGEYAASTESFRAAKKFAPDDLQADACVWYTLMNAMDKDPSAAVSLILSTMREWNDVSYFSDILDRLSAYLTGKRQWSMLLEIFSGLESRKAEGASLAQYAWILGRAAEEAYLKTERGAESFFRVAFEQSKGSYYYRAMAASKLKSTFAPEKENPEPPIAGEEADETNFLLGFFDCGAVSFAEPYLEAREKVLDISGLRKIAEALALSGRWKESLDLVSRYTNKENYELSRQDLVLFYPRPFLDLMEKYAGETEQGEEILYGLIRTESFFMPEIVSRSGAVGLAQLMAPTAAEMAGRIARQNGPDYRGPDGIDLKDPEVNVHIGSYYLRYLTGQMGSPMLALLAYNGGMGRMRRWLAADRQQKGGGLPSDLFLETIEFNETREYGRRVLAAAAVYGYLYYGMSMEQVAADIYGSR